MTTTLAPFTRRPRLALPQLLATLREQDARKQDMVVRAHQMRITPEGHLEVDTPRIYSTGVGPSLYRLTPTFDSGISGKLKIPAPYLSRMREFGQTRLLAENVNAWLAVEPNRPFLIRTFRGDGNELGVARALLSDSYALLDNLPQLLAMLKGIADRGDEVTIDGELTDRRMIVKIVSRVESTTAPELLRNYRSPFGGRTGAEDPAVFAGASFTNSEIGFGAATITPMFTVRICSNGMTITQAAKRTVHLGAKHDHGLVRYSADTLRRELAAATGRVRDAVSTFLDAEYMTRKLSEIEGRAQVEIIDPKATIEHVGRTVGYTADEQNLILAHFIRGGDTTAGGILHAVTSAAQILPDADAAYEMERNGLKALAEAASYQRHH